MKLKKRLYLPLAFVLLLVLSGCYEMEARKQIMSDGSANVEINYDFTAMVDMIGQMPDEEFNGDPPEDFSDFCDDFNPESVNMVGAQCIVDGYKVTIRGSLPEGSINLVSDADTYSYAIKDVYSFLNRIDADPNGLANGFDDEEDMGFDDGSTFSDEELREMGAMAPMMNLRMTYIIEMEGEIVSSDVGQINRNVVTINMFDLPNVENPVVTARVGGVGSSFDLDSQLFVIIGGILIGLIIIIVVVLAVAKSRKQGHSQEVKPQANTPAQQPVQGNTSSQQPVHGSTRVDALVKWIKQHEDQHSEQVLRQLLESRGYPKEEIEQAFARR